VDDKLHPTAKPLMNAASKTQQALLQRVQLLVQANRYSFLRRTNDAKLIAQVANKG
jgi:hypothetical protein